MKALQRSKNCILGDKNTTLLIGDYNDTLDTVSDINLVLTSPPYNIGSKSPKKTGKRKHGEYDGKSYAAIVGYEDNMPEDQYQAWQHDCLVWLSERLAPNGVIAYNHKPRHKNGYLIKPESWFPDCLKLCDEVVWNRLSTHNHCSSFVYPQREMIYFLVRSGEKKYFKNCPPCWDPNSKVKGVGDVWNVPPEKSTHNAPMPLSVATQIVRMWSKPNDLVCDPFSGSGTTMIAAVTQGRRFIGSEKLLNYAEDSVERYHSMLP